ncbi:MAG TPA: alpha/beta hydrolase [Acidothermaceae bacterium]|nr:alpha/beta hydrolase [Acidothermaceae bacterium]
MASCTVQGTSALCGTLSVPENRLTGRGRTIGINVVVVPASGADRAPDPIVWFAGGPGDSAVAAIQSTLNSLVDARVHRDLVFIDQRGTGDSNPLTCPSFPSADDKAAFTRSVESCLASLPADIRFYTTAMFVDDVDQVLGALGYRTANLMGISYGTTAEQVMLLRHPKRVRTVTLFSGTPLNAPLFERFPANVQAALDGVFARCEADSACGQAFPDLAGDWQSVWSALSQAPWVLPAASSPTGQAVTLDTASLASLTNNLLRNSITAAWLPVMVHTLATVSDHESAIASVATALLGSGFPLSTSDQNPMVTYPIMCNEPWESFRPEALADQRDSFEYASDLASAQWWQQVCALIPKSPVAAVGKNTPPSSSVPVLALNGSADPIEPPSNMANAERLWPNGMHVVEPAQGHDINGDAWSACLTSLTDRFISAGSVAGLDTSCLADIPARPFALDLSALTVS